MHIGCIYIHTNSSVLLLYLTCIWSTETQIPDGKMEVSLLSKVTGAKWLIFLPDFFLRRSYRSQRGKQQQRRSSWCYDPQDQRSYWHVQLETWDYEVLVLWSEYFWIGSPQDGQRESIYFIVSWSPILTLKFNFEFLVFGYLLLKAWYVKMKIMFISRLYNIESLCLVATSEYHKFEESFYVK